MNFIVFMFQFDEIWLGVRNCNFFHTNVSIDRVNDFGIIVEGEYLGRFVKAVDESNFLLICHWRLMLYFLLGKLLIALSRRGFSLRWLTNVNLWWLIEFWLIFFVKNSYRSFIKVTSNLIHNVSSYFYEFT